MVHSARLPLLFTIGVLFACASPRLEPPAAGVASIETLTNEPLTSAVRFRKEYILAPGDQIEVLVRRTPELSRTLLIRPDGYITLPLIKDVMAAGLTSRELEARITELLASRLIEPEVTVISIQVRQPVVYVVGDVNNNAATVPLRDAPTAMQAIAAAGGLRRSAAADEITLIRLSEEGFLRAIPVSTPLRGQPAPYVALRAAVLQPDDVVFIPENGRSQLARILDDFVNRPLAGINAITATYLNFRLVRVIDP